MNIIFLGPSDSPIISILQDDGNQVTIWEDPADVSLLERMDVKFAVSHGYRHIIKFPILRLLPDRVINLHISYLPWNRGADPNLWSFLEDTPKGVTIHYIDEGIDTGDVIAQQEVSFQPVGETLTTTYGKLQEAIVQLFREVWPLIKADKNPRRKQPVGGTLHKSSQKMRFQHLLTEGWNTPVNGLIGKAFLLDSDRAE